MRRSRPTDWKTFAGFAGLLFLIIVVGLIGIRQIQNLSRVIGHLAKVDMPLQSAVAEMKSAISQYAMGIRNYMFWRGARYLDAAAISGKLDLVRSASRDFDRHLSAYASLAAAPRQKAWIDTVRQSHQDLRQTGNKIIAIVEGLERVRAEDRKAQDDALARLLMDFENNLFQIDAFLDEPMQRFNLEVIDGQLEAAETDRARSVSLLIWAMAVGLLLGAQNALLIYARSRREKERREMLVRKVIKLEEEERNNLSLQVHDQMGQDLSALKIYLGLVEKDLPRELKDPRERIDKTKKILDGLIDKTHNISELLRPPELEDLGLVDSISAIIVHYREMTGMNYHYERPQQNLRLSPEGSLVLYRLVQEALTNAAKYAHARNITVALKGIGDGVRLVVADDGAGFDYKSALKRPERRKEDKVRLGLQGLRERIELLGGRMEVFSQPGKGTRIEATLFV